jgi:hypothetical protein
MDWLFYAGILKKLSGKQKFHNPLMVLQRSTKNPVDDGKMRKKG